MAQLHSGFGIAFVLGSEWDLQAVMVEGQGVIVGHGAGVLEAEVVSWVMFFQPGDISRVGLGGLDLEASIEFGQISARAWLALSRSQAPALRSSLTRRSCRVPHSRSIRPLVYTVNYTLIER